MFVPKIPVLSLYFAEMIWGSKAGFMGMGFVLGSCFFCKISHFSYKQRKRDAGFLPSV